MRLGRNRFQAFFVASLKNVFDGEVWNDLRTDICDHEQSSFVCVDGESVARPNLKGFSSRVNFRRARSEEKASLNLFQRKIF